MDIRTEWIEAPKEARIGGEHTKEEEMKESPKKRTGRGFRMETE